MFHPPKHFTCFHDNPYSSFSFMRQNPAFISVFKISGQRTFPLNPSDVSNVSIRYLDHTKVTPEAESGNDV